MKNENVLEQDGLPWKWWHTQTSSNTETLCSKVETLHDCIGTNQCTLFIPLYNFFFLFTDFQNQQRETSRCKWLSSMNKMIFNIFFYAVFLVLTVELLKYNQFTMLMLRIRQPFTIILFQQMVNHNNQSFILTIFLFRQMFNKPLIHFINQVHFNMLINVWRE